ncbi:glycosyl hydrolase 5 family protein-like [Quercus robur]|uniref:glycosyl hydrolase 5 family protein-like n=1 Tax=Quercus robur TaxID=38942 RepID=UPI002163D32C|nr:glycosyl hydrolase 5 family protein-like [Quercus robur]
MVAMAFLVMSISMQGLAYGTKSNSCHVYRISQCETVNSANPNILVVVSGLNFDLDLSFLGNKSVNLSFTKKLVFEAHRYGFTDLAIWESNDVNKACGIVRDDMTSKTGFLLDKGFPLFVSEFGMDERETNTNDNKFMNCFLSYAAELDFDWAIWALTGSYHIREGTTDMEEFDGLLNFDWSSVRNPGFLQRISTIQSPSKGPGLPETNTTINFPSFNGFMRPKKIGV